MTTATLAPGSILRVDRLPGGDRRLVRDLQIDLGVDIGVPSGEFQGFAVVDGSTRITVPCCFVTDFSSIPAWARGLYRFSTVDLAGVCHDWAYRLGVDRKIADRCWRIVATSGDARVGTMKGRLGYLALRLGGKDAYEGNREKREAGDVVDAPVGPPCTCQPCGEGS